VSQISLDVSYFGSLGIYEGIFKERELDVESI
jgi:hypothetical protein